jgi:hypothetical protein
MNTATAPSVSPVSGNTTNTSAVALPVSVTPSIAQLRVISQPVNGTVGVSNHVLTYFPATGFTGTDTFTYAAWDGAKNSGLATGTVTVVPGATTPTAMVSIETQLQDIVLRWSATSNRTYRVQYTSDLAQPTWTDLSGDVSAIDGFASKLASKTSAVRFYRVRVLP